MIPSIAWRCSGVNSAAATVPDGIDASIAPMNRPTAHKPGRRKRVNSITMTTPISRREGRRSIVEALRLAVNILGACIGRRAPGQQLLRPSGLLHRILFLAGG